MTIAAGFVHRDGVLLCADTEHQNGAMKHQGTKIVEFERHGKKGAFTFAGNTLFAVATIQKCKRELKKAPPQEETLSVIERVLDAEYRRVVHQHPNQSTDSSVHYWLLAAIPGEQGVELYQSYETSFLKADNFSAIGIGDTFARQVIGPSFSGRAMSERKSFHLAAYMLKMVKKHVIGCSGWSQLISLRHDGSVAEFFMEPAIGHIEKWAGIYAMLAQDLMFEHIDPTVTNAEFDRSISEFIGRLKMMKHEWDQAIKPSGDSSPRD